MHITANAGTIVEPLLSIAAVVTFSTGVYSFSTTDIPLRAYFAGISAGLASVCLSQSVAIGRAGPAASLAMLQTPVAVMLNAMFENQTPNYLEIISMCLGLIGALMITIGQDIFTLCRTKTPDDYK